LRKAGRKEIRANSKITSKNENKTKGMFHYGVRLTLSFSALPLQLRGKTNEKAPEKSVSCFRFITPDLSLELQKIDMQP
jgi:hypothetical protein